MTRLVLFFCLSCFFSALYFWSVVLLSYADLLSRPPPPGCSSPLFSLPCCRPSSPLVAVVFVEVFLVLYRHRANPFVVLVFSLPVCCPFFFAVFFIGGLFWFFLCFFLSALAPAWARRNQAHPFPSHCSGAGVGLGPPSPSPPPSLSAGLLSHLDFIPHSHMNP